MASLNGPARRSAPAASPWAWAPLFLLTTSCQVIFGLDEYTERTGGTGGGTSTTTSSGGGGGAGGAGGSTTGTGGQGGTGGTTTDFPADRDTYLFSTNENYNYGADPVLKLSGTQRAILHFDISNASGIPPAAVHEARLTLHVTSGAPVPGIEVFRIAPENSDWIEGAGKGLDIASAGEPCWHDKKYQQQGWASTQFGLTVEGSDYVPGAIAPTVDGELYTWVVTDIVKLWLGANPQDVPNDNAGFLVVSTGASYDIASKESTTGTKPKLSIDHDLP
ncbi:MAG: DNRLRE domain-containing protein [Polyangiaceae bacterium]|nr:DNRLRE domain-containing protein [Polyangiaceae bacterium]